ncbi:lipoyl synthase [bacterium]|nr:lipoyl synthase [bacterium]
MPLCLSFIKILVWKAGFTVYIRKPEWLNKKINFNDCRQIKSLISDLNLHSVCQEAACPNISECFSRGEATFLILGKTCTRGCMFCNVDKGIPSAPDEEEPKRVAQAVARLKLKHIVITSVTRDDLADGGADIYARTIFSIRRQTKEKKVTIEVLIPDFGGNEDALRIVVRAKPDIIGHNLETVPRLYQDLRQGADYFRTLTLLEKVKDFNPQIYTKSSLMLGLGEEEEEVLSAFSNLRRAGCDFLSIGQYLAPTLQHYPVKKYFHPREFTYYQNKAKSMGFLYVVSGPYVRSSYRAGEYLPAVKTGLKNPGQ